MPWWEILILALICWPVLVAFLIQQTRPKPETFTLHVYAEDDGSVVFVTSHDDRAVTYGWFIIDTALPR
jgi:hypothetical protein